MAKGAVILLDWAKAFDRVKHHKLWEALRRHGVPATLVLSLYVLPLFRFTTEGTSSDWQRQERCIRQGCP